ncbi:MAG: transglycosylase family protein [Solirubrobacteraceae bacterium]
MSHSRLASLYRVAIGAALIAALALTGIARQAPAGAATLGQLNSQLGTVQSRQQHLSSSVNSLSGLISSLSSQIQLVQTREAAVRAQLVTDRADLARATVALKREQAIVLKLRRRLAWARMLLSRQLVSSYEGSQPDLVSVVLNASGFNNLLEQIAFLDRAEHQQQVVIALTRQAKREADAAAVRLTKLEVSDRRIAAAATLRANALQGMNELLQSRQGALQRARYAQQLALDAAQAEGQRLESRIARIRAQQAAAAAAARAAAAAQSAPQAPVGSPSAPPSLGPSGGWAIPYAIVLCESGGQNLPPNSAGASGYYQIIPSTWRLFGGTGPAAYLASKAEQDAVATRIWNGGAGASNWVCAGIVGIH